MYSTYACNLSAVAEVERRSLVACRVKTAGNYRILGSAMNIDDVDSQLWGMRFRYSKGYQQEYSRIPDYLYLLSPRY